MSSNNLTNKYSKQKPKSHSRNNSPVSRSKSQTSITHSTEQRCNNTVLSILWNWVNVWPIRKSAIRRSLKRSSESKLYKAVSTKKSSFSEHFGATFPFSSMFSILKAQTSIMESALNWEISLTFTNCCFGAKPSSWNALRNERSLSIGEPAPFESGSLWKSALSWKWVPKWSPYLGLTFLCTQNAWSSPYGSLQASNEVKSIV